MNVFIIARSLSLQGKCYVLKIDVDAGNERP